MTTMFIVMGQAGEYDAHSVFLSGVFASKEDAIAAMQERMTKAREYAAWCKRVSEAWPKLPWGYFKFPLAGAQADEYAALTARAEAAAGPKPEYEPAERVELFEVPVGVWLSDGCRSIFSADSDAD